MRITFPKLAISVAALLFLSSPAQAEVGIASTGLNVRAGPGPYYPVVGYIRQGTEVDIIGCVNGWKWCDVQTGGTGLFGLFGGGGGRGWVAGNYLNGYYNNNYSPVSGIGSLLGLSTLSFDEPDYWGKYYYDRPFYRARYYNTRYWNENARLKAELRNERERNEILRERRRIRNQFDIDRWNDRRENARAERALEEQRAALHNAERREAHEQKREDKQDKKYNKHDDKHDNKRGHDD